MDPIQASECQENRERCHWRQTHRSENESTAATRSSALSPSGSPHAPAGHKSGEADEGTDRAHDADLADLLTFSFLSPFLSRVRQRGSIIRRCGTRVAQRPISATAPGMATTATRWP